MRRPWSLCFFIAVCSLATGQAWAQLKSQGYAFLAPGGTSPETRATLHFGAGGEVLVHKGLGAGAELGYLAPTESLGDGSGLFSVNASYHFLGSSGQKLVPFITGGYSLGFRSETAHFANFGLGLSYWFRDRMGLRVEFRDHVRSGDGSVHFWGFRLGVAFR